MGALTELSGKVRNGRAWVADKEYKIVGRHNGNCRGCCFFLGFTFEGGNKFDPLCEQADCKSVRKHPVRFVRLIPIAFQDTNLG